MACRETGRQGDLIYKVPGLKIQFLEIEEIAPVSMAGDDMR
jgi:hypothetical protein